MTRKTQHNIRHQSLPVASIREHPDTIPVDVSDVPFALPADPLAEIAKLRAALRPFAMSYDPGMPDERMLMFASKGGGTYLGWASVSDLKRAREVFGEPA